MTDKKRGPSTRNQEQTKLTFQLGRRQQSRPRRAGLYTRGTTLFPNGGAYVPRGGQTSRAGSKTIHHFSADTAQKVWMACSISSVVSTAQRLLGVFLLYCRVTY